MFELKGQYGGIEKRSCAQCKKTVKATWVACPHCGHSLGGGNNPSPPKHECSVNDKQAPVSHEELLKWAKSAIGLATIDAFAEEWADDHEYFFKEYDFKLFKRLHVYAMSLGGPSLMSQKDAANWVVQKMLEGGPEATEEELKAKMTAERTSEHKEKGCFISTAVVSNFNLPDDCRELNILRRFRDTYMRCTPERQQEVEEYYRIAPGIVEAVSQRADASDIWRALWASHLAPAIAAIECGDDDRAHSIYRDMVAALSHLLEPAGVGHP